MTLRDWKTRVSGSQESGEKIVSGTERFDNSTPRLDLFSLILALILQTACSQALRQSPVTAGIAEVNETRLYYEMMGEGRPLVLIHGGAVDRRMWDDQFQVFAEHYRVIRYDQRGAGRSAIPMKRFSNVEDLLGLLQFLKVDKAYLLGLSRGGGIARDFTLKYPERVNALILASSNLGGMPAAYREMFARLYSAARDEGVSRGVEVWLNDPYQAPGKENGAARERFRKIVTENLVVNMFLLFDTQVVQRPALPASQRISEISVPTLVIFGERDHSDAHANYNRAAAGIPGAKKVEIRDAAHLVNVDQPVQFNQAVLDFLSSLPER